MHQDFNHRKDVRPATPPAELDVVVRESPREVVVSFEMGHVLRENLHVEVCGRSLRISGRPADNSDEEMFQAEITMPMEVKADHAIGEIVENQLIVRLPKAAPHRVPVLRDVGGSRTDVHDEPALKED